MLELKIEKGLGFSSSEFQSILSKKILDEVLPVASLLFLSNEDAIVTISHYFVVYADKDKKIQEKIYFKIDSSTDNKPDLEVEIPLEKEEFVLKYFKLTTDHKIINRKVYSKNKYLYTIYYKKKTKTFSYRF